MNVFARLFISAFFVTTVSAQDAKKKIVLPDIPGFKTLKCDFHLHTVFSDGHVWPTLRVQEAVRDGLDAISLTEHIDFESKPDELERNYNRAFEIAEAAAKGKNLIVIKGGEISPRVPPYHNNALFLKDANRIPSPYMKSREKKFEMKPDATREELMAPFLEVQRQGAFVLYNHPGYSWWDTKDTVEFTDFHEELLQKGILSGVEVANSGHYNVIGHRIAMKHNLTMFGNSDAHGGIFPSDESRHRSMTLVFAGSKSPEAIREALEQRRTAVFVDDYIIARKPEAEAFFKASFEVRAEKKKRKQEPQLHVFFKNKTSVPYRVRIKSRYDTERMPLGLITLEANAITEVIFKAVWKYPEELPIEMEVFNILVSPEEALKTVWDVRVGDSEGR